MNQIDISLHAYDAPGAILKRMPGAERSEIERLLADRDALAAYLALTNDLTRDEAEDTLASTQFAKLEQTQTGALKAA